MSRLLAVALILSVSPALAADQEVCIVQDPNQAIASMAHDGAGEVPMLTMTMAGGYQGIMVANAATGSFTLLVLAPSGRACLLAIGTDLKPATAETRFKAEKSQ
jgi:hypothetical protein